MLGRSARRLAVSRQALPRPHKLYTTPSTPRNAAAAAASAPVHTHDLPPYLAGDSAAFTGQLADFLGRRRPLTLLTTPRQKSRQSPDAAPWCADSLALDQTGIIDACLHDLYDVPRAHGIFARLREARSPVLETGLYNALIEAYTGMAKREGEASPVAAKGWIDKALELYYSLEAGKEPVGPNTKTYSLMLAIWHSFHESQQLDLTPGSLLPVFIKRGYDPLSVVNSPAFTDSETLFEVAKALSRAAVDLNLPSVVADLGHVDPPAQVLVDDVYKDVPEVTPVFQPLTPEQAEAGMEPTTPYNLSSLRQHLQNIVHSRQTLGSDLEARQRHVEASVNELAIEQSQHLTDIFADKGIDPGIQDVGIQKWLWEWHTLMTERLKTEIAKIQASEARDEGESKKKKPSIEPTVGPYLTVIKPETMSLLTIMEVMRTTGNGGVSGGTKMARSLISVGKAVENEYKAQVCKKNSIPIPKMPNNRTDGIWSDLGYRHLFEQRVAAARSLEGESWTATWSQTMRSRVGAVLVECLMDVAKVSRTANDPVTGEVIKEVQPAFYSSYEYLRGQKLGVLKLNPVVAERLAKDSVQRMVHPRHLPMLVKPKPWINHREGGYFVNKSSVMRFKDSIEQEMYLKNATEQGHCELVYTGLDVLGSTPWRVNRDIFDVVIKVWNQGTRMGKIPPATFDVPEPVLDPAQEKDLEARSIHIQKHRQWSQNKANNHSERCAVNYKVEIAKAFLGDVFYLPHNLDFRGRAYPIPPHLNHIGDDLSRALLVFAEGKPLGERGLRWLKIHMANLYGFDKANFEERVQWVEERLPQIFDSALRPLDGEMWWTKADDPWQCLATCKELYNALHSENPLEYVSRLPVHQDGTCNGLQHYAALGGDDTGARQVNLLAGDRPSDVYTHVSRLVEAMVEEDAKKGDVTAQLLVGKITRKVVKQTVMTTVYGVTYVGARDQIDKQLRDRGDIPIDECWSAAAYVASRTLSCIGDTFSGAKHIQTWLNICARLISKSIPDERLRVAKGPSVTSNLSKKDVKKEQMTSVIWETPLGLPIVQPYRKTARKQIYTNIQSLYISDPMAPFEVNSIKQASAFPPNFIHSLDATHMMLTAIECARRNLTFASVHDSYWTHASDVDTMSTVIRDTFIALHSSHILEKLLAQIETRYANFYIPLEAIGGPTGTIIRNLKTLGTRIKVHKDEDYDLLSRLGFKNMLELVKPGEGEEVATKEERPLILAGKFVRLAGLLPPLPSKGSFKVEDIKASPYFFS